MNIQVNSNFILKRAVSSKWGKCEELTPGSDARKEWFYQKLAAVRRTKLLRCSEQQNHRCCYCGHRTWHPAYGETGNKRRLATLEHVVTRREGGTDSMNNLAMACSRCNNSRSDYYTAVEFYEMIIGVRPMIARTAEPKSKEQEAIRKAKQRDRSATATVYAAYTLSALNMWEWFDSWLTTYVPMLD